MSADVASPCAASGFATGGQMRAEALSATAHCASFAAAGLAHAWRTGQSLRERAIDRVEWLGRGSSGHAGTLLRYALAAGGGVSVSAAMPSIAAAPGALAHLRGAAVLALSQSGRSPDLLRYAQQARQQGAEVVAITNAEGTPLGAAATVEIALGGGPEIAVAATKSVLLSLMAGLGLVAGFRDDRRLLDDLQRLPARLRAAAGCDWTALTQALAGSRACYVLARGPELGIAKELALKVAEVTGVPALAFSSAEFLHGPLGAVGPDTPVLAIASLHEARDSALRALSQARTLGAPTLLAPGETGEPHVGLALPPSDRSLTDALLPLIPAWLAIEAAARAAGRDPDQPRGLAKVTETL